MTTDALPALAPPSNDDGLHDMDLLIEFTSADGETREEHWRSVDAFRSWAVAQNISGIYTAYRADDDGEWVVMEKGSIGVPPLSRRPRRPR